MSLERYAGDDEARMDELERLREGLCDAVVGEDKDLDGVDRMYLLGFIDALTCAQFPGDLGEYTGVRAVRSGYRALVRAAMLGVL